MSKYTVDIQQEVLLRLYLDAEAKNPDQAKQKGEEIYEFEIDVPNIQFYKNENWKEPQWGDIQTTICEN